MWNCRLCDKQIVQIVCIMTAKHSHSDTQGIVLQGRGSAKSACNDEGYAVVAVAAAGWQQCHKQ